ncbi:sigma 54-interacting transcriptional regulator [Kosakonia sp. BYX6]|uniref:Sigma 54-interacting transcriptional regulator n=1 Tax=Kosakonia calanthes TaxID=3139408 RepID=A0ABZ3B1A4_9ENTR
MTTKNLPNLALITPYPHLGDIVIMQCAGIFNCHVYHGSLEKAISIARNLDSDYYDVILSRGGTAEYIENATVIPVVRIHTSMSDLLKSLIPLKNHSHKIAFFNYQKYLPDVVLAATALNIVIDEFVFDSQFDMTEKLKLCRANHYETVTGGCPVAETAKQYAMQGILIENGVESVTSALREALAIVETTRRKMLDMTRLEIILSSITEGIIVTNENNDIQIFNKAAETIFGLTGLQVLGKQIDSIIKNTRINQVLLSKSPEIRELQELDNTSIITSRVPMFMGRECIGVVCSFTDTPQIQKVERIIRGKLKKKGFDARYTFDHILSADSEMQAIKKLAQVYARTDSPVMIYGESGTGKELFAQSIHNHSNRRHGPFVAINCAAIPENLLESELFGYEGGSFTGARREGKEGLIELAHQGTLFLDEIGEMPLPIQSRLLRVLQEYEIMHIGGKDVIPVDVRIIGATNRALASMAEDGTFRSDLFYRLNVLPLTVPPLRERAGDFRYLATKFLCETAAEHLLEQFLDLFCSYRWPGNVREMRFIIERLALLSVGFPQYSLREMLTLTGFRFPDAVSLHPNNEPVRVDLSKGQLKNVIKDVERQVIVFYLERYEQNQDKVAMQLGISKMSLWRKLKVDEVTTRESAFG